jgi:hypothetical protein
MTNASYLLAFEDGTGCSDTLAYKLQTAVNHPEQSAYIIQDTGKFGTAPLTSRRCILNIYSTNIYTEYFKNSA